MAGMFGRLRAGAAASAAAAAMWLSASPASAQLLMSEPPEETHDVEVIERLGERIPLRLEFTDSRGDTAPLASHFDGEKPVMLVLGYYGCPVVCPTIYRLMTECFNELNFTVGEDFRVVSVSIDPTETRTHAQTELDKQLARYNSAERDASREVIEGGWHFLTGEQAEIEALADAVGYRYKPLPSGEYSHPVALAVLSPDGMISRYIYGFTYPPFDVRLSLLEASQGRIAKSFGDRLLHFCYTFDPNAGAYTLEAFAVMRIGAGLTVVVLGGFIGGLFLWERRKRRGDGGSGDGEGPLMAARGKRVSLTTG